MNRKKKSCGCVRGNRGNPLPPGEAAFNSLYGKYRKSAERRNKVFDLTKDDFKKLTSSNCVYCGKPPAQSARSSTGTVFSKSGKAYCLNGEYAYNGIDRADNTIGYTKNNCVPCCDTCNRAKWCMSQREFFEWIHSVCDHFDRVDNSEQNHLGRLWMKVRAELRQKELAEELPIR